MFSDIGPLELVALVVLAVLIFGPDKLPKVVQDVSRFLRKMRSFSDNAKEDIRSELGPEFKDFDFEDLNPKNFARKHLLDGSDFGTEDLRSSFDLRKDLNTLAGPEEPSPARGKRVGLDKSSGSAERIDMTKKPGPSAAPAVPFDPDAT